MADPTFRGFELELGCVQPWTGLEQDIQKVRVPGFNGVLIKHMGEREREFTIEGTFTSVDSDGFSKLKELEERNDKKVGDLVILDGGLTYSKVRITGISYGRFYKNAVTGFLDIKYSVRFEQLSDSGTITSPDEGP